MKQKKYIGIEPKVFQTVVSGMFLLLSTACVSSSDIKNKPQAELSSKQKQTLSATTHVHQIGQQNSALDAAQISSSVEAEQLTINQLKVYADRCSPNATELPPKGLDCSELNLRVKRLYKSDDDVTEALVTLDRLGRNDNIDNIDSALKDLEDDKPGLSFNSQAIAGSVTTPQTPAPTESQENLEEFLNENGLSINAGAIIANRG